MHCLFAHNDYGRRSGEEEAVERIAGLLQEAGHRISWLRRSSAEIDGSLKSKVTAFAAGIWSHSAYREMARQLADDRPDVVQVQNIYPFLSSSILAACREARVPVVMRTPNYRLFCPTGLHLRDGSVCVSCLSRGRELNCVRYNCEGNAAKSIGYAARNAFNRLTGTILDNVDRVIVLSQFQRRRFEAQGIAPDSIAVVPNVAPVDEIQATPVPTRGYVAFVGRLEHEKGVHELLDAARMLPDVQFAIAGAIGHSSELPRVASGNVRFDGFLGGRTLRDFYAGSRIVVCPSKWFEGFPNVIASAMAHGRPVVASRIGAIPEIVRDGVTGLLCEPGDSRDLASKIDALLRSETTCALMGRQGRRIAEEEYSPQEVLSKWIRIYSSLSCVA
jgi:glycosyltransferase involved in cell wall biosynthesis